MSLFYFDINIVCMVYTNKIFIKLTLIHFYLISFATYYIIYKL